MLNVTDWLQSLGSFGSTSAPQTTTYSTLAPTAWQQQVAAQPGFSNLASGGGGVATAEPSFLDGMLGFTDSSTGLKNQGWGGLALGAAQGLGNAWMGMKQYGLAEDAFEESKRQFGLNYEAQKKLTNSQLADRQRARVASNPNGYQSEAEYMAQYGV